MNRRLAVFCGSHTGKYPAFKTTTQLVAEFLAVNNIELIYGGGRLGLMGVLADTMLQFGGTVIGVETKLLLDKEGHRGLTELHLVETMHERKALMSQLSEAFLLLPGGAGSLDEFFEAYTWSQLSLHQKPCAILNVDHYYDSLIQFIDHAVENEFINREDRKKMHILNSVPSILDLWS